MHKIEIKRIYETPSGADGYRMLVDRLWPRGLKKEDAFLDEWNKAISPSPELRKWFAHKPERFTEFAKRYIKELDANKEEVDKIRKLLQKRKITLLYAAKDPEINHATVLQNYLSSQRIKI